MANGILRVRMTGRDTVFELSINKRDVKQACLAHIERFGREMVPSGEKDAKGRDVYITREVPKELFLFEWVENLGKPNETVEPITFT